MEKNKQITNVRKLAAESGLRIVEEDTGRPWGASFMLDEAQLETFVAQFFPGLTLPANDKRGKMSPKFLLVGSGHRLSWQYHLRRSEHWRVVNGPVSVAKSQNDIQSKPKSYSRGDEIHLAQGERHRLVGLNDWGLVAEIWTHTDPSTPSNEEDIVRLEDDYSRG